MDVAYGEVAGMIDHALLRPDLTDREIEAACRRAADYDVGAVCVKPCQVEACLDWLRGSAVMVGTVVGFPQGGHAIRIKRAETEQALCDGAREVDAVVNIGKVLSGDWTYVEKDLAAVIAPCREAGRIVKIIFETCYLEDDAKVRLCEMCSGLGADFVKTSTGFASGGATLADVRLMRRSVPDRVGVKASGGIRTLADLLAFRAAGASRIGCSNTFDILDAVRNGS